MEKYGFVYLWRDRKYKRYYIGCHWGHVNDGYICSSNSMRNAYRRRPEDFTRRILKAGLSSKLITLTEEYKWLQLIEPNELGRKYYNRTTYNYYDKGTPGEISVDTRKKLSNIAKVHWKRLWSDPNYKKRMLEIRKEQCSAPEYRKKLSNSLRGIKKTKEWKVKIGNAHRGKEKKYDVWNKGKIGLYYHSDASKNKTSNSMKRMHSIRMNLPDIEILRQEVYDSNISQVAKKYNVSRKTIRDRVKAMARKFSMNVDDVTIEVKQ